MPSKPTAQRVLHAGLVGTMALTIAACGSTTTTTVRSDPLSHHQSARAAQARVGREAEAHNREAVAQAERADAAAKQREREAQEPAERWRALQHDLVGALVLEGGAEVYERISREAEIKGRAYGASEIKALVESLSTTRAELATIAEHSQHACASAIEGARMLLKRRQSVVEQTRINSMGSEYGWANTAHELEPLELPEGHLGDGLQTCDPSGTGEIEGAESSSQGSPES
jgi:hypothetical protein